MFIHDKYFKVINMNLQFLCASKIASYIRTKKLSLKQIDNIPKICKLVVLKFLSYYDLNSHKMRYENCMAEMEIMLCNDCDTEIVDGYMNYYDEIITLYFRDRIKCVNYYGNSNFSAYCNILSNKTWFNNRYYKNTLNV